LAFGPNQGATSASVYLGYYTLTSYDPYKCQQYCDQATNCYAFNIYYERDPTKDPNAVNCPNPASTVNIKVNMNLMFLLKMFLTFLVLSVGLSD
jgi:hypothetical protein